VSMPLMELKSIQVKAEQTPQTLPVNEYKSVEEEQIELKSPSFSVLPSAQ
ncbi:MAG: hypothetical protein JSR33_10440, partial [Proteobacteria bacterium]|nr:hypothetical protein [Pseudomonadota bacterium]